MWRELVQHPEPVEGDNRQAQWTRDILQLMLLVIVPASILTTAVLIAGQFSIWETSPVYLIFIWLGLAWWATRRGAWRLTRFAPALLFICLGAYASLVVGLNASALFYALAILLAGMLVNRSFQFLVTGVTILLMAAGGFTQGLAVFMADLGRFIANSFMLIGVSLLQWYYDSRIKRILTDLMNANRVLTEEGTLRRRAEVDLNLQESQFRRLAENTTDLICDMAPDGIIRYASPSFFRILGYEVDKLIGTQVYDLVHPDDRQATMHGAAVAQATRTMGKVQPRLRHADGHYIQFENVGSPIIDEAGNFQGFVVVCRDISYQKQVEAAQQESEEKFHHFIESSPMGIHTYSLDDDGQLVFDGYNQAANRMLGIDHADLLGKTIEEAFPLLIETEIPALYRQIARRDNGHSYRQVSYADQIIHGTFEVYPFQITPKKMGAIFLDISDRIKANEALRLSEEKFSKAFLISPDSININRLSDGLYIDINQGFTHMTGYTRADVTGKTSADLNIWVDPADRARLVKGLLETGEVENLEAKFRFKDGTIITGLMSARIIDINGEQCILTFTRDITERIRAEVELRAAHARLEEAYEATLQGWVRALDLREHETADHSRRVVELTLAVAAKLGISGDELLDIQRGALLHDIGKIGVPDSILLKPGSLSPEEWVIMRYHPGYACELLEQIPFLAHSIDIPYCHHERWDGTGYPRGISGTEIPLPARIFSVVDVFDALLSNRPYRPAWAKKDVIRYLKEQKGKQFDPDVVDIFLTII